MSATDDPMLCEWCETVRVSVENDIQIQFPGREPEVVCALCAMRYTKWKDGKPGENCDA